MFSLLDDKDVIHIPKPYLLLVGGSVDGLDFKLFHEEVGHNGADGGTCGCTMHAAVHITYLGRRRNIYC